MSVISLVEGLFAGKPQPYGKRKTLSSIEKTPHSMLNMGKLGAFEDEQGNKKLHGGPFMACHQYAQASYKLLQENFPEIAGKFFYGSIGENVSAPSMNENSVFIGDEYKLGSTVLRVVSPRAPCSRINERYGKTKIDQFIAQHGITGWYYSVVEEGRVHLGDKIELIKRLDSPVSVKQVWQIRNLKEQVNDPGLALKLAYHALQQKALSPEWQGHLNRTIKKIQRLSN